MYSVKLQWKNFNVDVSSINDWAKAQWPENYKGSSADSMLTLWFDGVDPSIAPYTESIEQEEQVRQVEVQVPMLNGEGQPMLDSHGSPMMTTELQEETVMVDVVVRTPTGEPSIAQICQEKWDDIEADSDEAVAYAQKAQMAVVKAQVERISKFSQELLNQFAAENIAMGITADNKTEEVLDIMLPVMSALQGGAPTVAIKRAKQIDPADYDAKYVTAARLLSYVNKIEAFLGLPLSNSL